MIAERARKGLNVPTTSAIFDKLHEEDPYSEANQTVIISEKSHFEIKINSSHRDLLNSHPPIIASVMI
jgi:hypothetical protein